MDKLNLKLVIRTVVVLVTLVFALAVAGASADGVRGDHNDGNWTHFYTANTSFNSFSTIHSDWNFGGFYRESGLRDGFWFKSWDEGNSWSKYDFWTKDILWTKDSEPNDSSWCDPNSPGPTATPEPGTLGLLALGMTALFFMGRRSVLQE
jgi:PEP-CTERM motif